MKINNIDYTDETQYYQYTDSTKTTSNDFDSIFEAETTIYATPATSATQAGTSNTQSVTSSANLDDIFKRAAQQYGVSECLLKAVAKTESNFNPNATSSAGAMGVMQLMPDTASSLGVTDAYNAEQNIMGGAKYLSQLLDKYNGNTSLALAAYNAGPGNVDKYNGIPPFKETQNYVEKVLSYMDNSDYDTSTTYASAQPASDNNTTYVAAQPASTATSTDDSVVTIYAVASNDVTNPSKLTLG